MERMERKLEGIGNKEKRKEMRQKRKGEEGKAKEERR